MRIDLAQQAKAKGTRPKTVEMRANEPTRAQERDMARLYMMVLRVWATGVKEKIFPAYKTSLEEQRFTRDSARDIEFAIGIVESEAVRSTFTFRNLFQGLLGRIQQWHLRRIVNDLKYKTGVDLATQMTAGDVASTLEDVLARNVALVRNVSDQARGRISDIVFRGLQNRTSASEVAKELNRALKLGRDRSMLIARDQLTKLSAALDQERQEQLGITDFEWMHSGKTHYRPEHKERDGNVYAWDSDVGRNDPPGRAINCGCKAKGVLRIE